MQQTLRTNRINRPLYKAQYENKTENLSKKTINYPSIFKVTHSYVYVEFLLQFPIYFSFGGIEFQQLTPRNACVYAYKAEAPNPICHFLHQLIKFLGYILLDQIPTHPALLTRTVTALTHILQSLS